MRGPCQQNNDELILAILIIVLVDVLGGCVGVTIDEIGLRGGGSDNSAPKVTIDHTFIFEIILIEYDY